MSAPIRLCVDRSGVLKNSPPNQSIYLYAIYIVQLLQRLLDLPLVRLDIADKNQRIVLFNFLHRALCV